jgi:NAD(P)-dependent dehydrogenase (short-subunit alcohol dehydrogenase family)
MVRLASALGPLVFASVSHRTVALVFGANGGIGGAAVQGFLRRGCHVVGIDPSYPADRSIVRDRAVRAFGCRVDRADHEVFTQIREHLDQSVHHVCIAIGGAHQDEIDLGPGVLDTSQSSLLGSVMESNFSEVVAIISGVLPLLAADGAASVTVASSINASGDFGYPFYSASKAAIEGFVISTARHLGRKGVRINAVAFGTVVTERSLALHSGDPNHYDRLARLSATGRLTSEAEAGGAMVSLALDLTNVTGTVLICDGGQSIPGDHSVR